MSTETAPFDPLPWVSVEPEGDVATFIAVDCKASDCKCKHRSTLLYLPVIVADPEAIRRAVEEHRGCV